ncbi:MAG: hypothetical protein LBD02_02780 [Christensenellaceae bacterium]|jgi:hypothetical protein|nr:hypothetical protein [Christensenellaceae bacterium]
MAAFSDCQTNDVAGPNCNFYACPHAARQGECPAYEAYLRKRYLSQFDKRND